MRVRSVTLGIVQKFKKSIFVWMHQWPLLLRIVHPSYRLFRKFLYEWPLYWGYRALARFFPTPALTPDGGKRPLPVLLSLTSYGNRLEHVAVCIETLMRQSVKPDRMVLWVSEWDMNLGLPEILWRLEKRGLEIRSCPDLKSYKKLIPALAEYGDYIIVTADDDVFYPRGWLKSLLEASEAMPNIVHCHHSQLITLNGDGLLRPYVEWEPGNSIAGQEDLRVFPVGVGGVLYPPHCFADPIDDVALFERLSPGTDDIWFKAMTMLKGVKCRQTQDYPYSWTSLPGTIDHGLYIENVDGGGNDRNLEAVFNNFELHAILLDAEHESHHPRGI